MAKKSHLKHNRTFWRKLDNLKPVDEEAIIQIMNTRIHEYEEYIQQSVPYRYGGLSESVYGEVSYGKNGQIIGNVGISPTRHLDKHDGTLDNFTNTKLATWLTFHKNVKAANPEFQSYSYEQMQEVHQLLNECGYAIRDDIKQYWKSNGGK